MAGTPGGTPDRPALFFSGPEEFRAWLQEHHDRADELWMGLYKKHVEGRGLVWEQAVREALCFGWIDSKVQRIDEDAVRQRWTPRKPGSAWSTVNVAAVEELVEQGRMHPAGLAAFERRRPDRQGIYSYEQDGEAELDPAHAQRLRADPAASAWLDAAPASYRRTCLAWVAAAKRPETRDRRVEQLLEDSRHGRLIPPQRYGAEPAWVRRVREALGMRDADG